MDGMEPSRPGLTYIRTKYTRRMDENITGGKYCTIKPGGVD